ncbi:hypothetical protein A9Q99_21175 [Gammaproteobacteria bacterium 45_16_T64]|nr:hypothetical protein A9Q99_21175 [Gammaproteobacteria bacterium 45_16_T64]
MFERGEKSDDLLFDEKDELFGPRGDSVESHDKFANVESNYLLRQVKRIKLRTVFSRVLVLFKRK